MKKLLYFFVLFASCHAIALNSGNVAGKNYFIDTKDSLKVFLSITHNDAEVSATVRSTIKHMNGTTILAYCDNHALFMIQLDNTAYRDANDFIVELKKLLPKYELLFNLKEGDFDAFLQYCEPSDDKDAKNIKKQFQK